MQSQNLSLWAWSPEGNELSLVAVPLAAQDQLKTRGDWTDAFQRYLAELIAQSEEPITEIRWATEDLGDDAHLWLNEQDSPLKMANKLYGHSESLQLAVSGSLSGIKFPVKGTKNKQLRESLQEQTLSELMSGVSIWARNHG